MDKKRTKEEAEIETESSDPDYEEHSDSDEDNVMEGIINFDPKIKLPWPIRRFTNRYLRF